LLISALGDRLNPLMSQNIMVSVRVLRQEPALTDFRQAIDDYGRDIAAERGRTLIFVLAACSAL